MLTPLTNEYAIKFQEILAKLDYFTKILAFLLEFISLA